MDVNSYEAVVPPLVYSHTGQGYVFQLLDANPTLNQLASQLRELINKNPDSALSQYVGSIIDQPRGAAVLRYFDNGAVPNPVFDSRLPEGFTSLQGYKETPGVYHFVGADGQDYVGSTMDLKNRLNHLHRPRGLNPNQTYRHSRFYQQVIDHG